MPAETYVCLEQWNQSTYERELKLTHDSMPHDGVVVAVLVAVVVPLVVGVVVPVDLVHPAKPPVYSKIEWMDKVSYCPSLHLASHAVNGSSKKNLEVRVLV